MTLADFRKNLLLLVVMLYLVLNYGFMQVRILSTGGSGIPIGELVLLFSLITINYDRLLPRISEIILLIPFILWWVLGLARILTALPKYGFWALRDANHVIESLFLIVGFALAACPQTLERVFSCLKKTLVVVCLYALSFPFRDTLQPLSPQLIAGSGQETPLFFNYVNTSTLLLLFTACHLIVSKSKKVHNVIVTLVLGYTIFVFQTRTIYLQAIGIFLLLAFYRRRILSRGIIIILVLFGFLAIVSMVGLRFKGRMGEVSFEFFANHFLAIGGVKSEGLEGAASGVPQRLEWWWDLYEQWTSSASTFVFGLGYGFPLIDFSDAQSVTVREPHNSYISIVARLGLLGSFAFLWMHILLLRVWHHMYRACGRIYWQEGENRLLILMSFFVLVWLISIGEDGFEKPFFTIPYYFFWGITLRMNWHLKHNSPIIPLQL